MASACCNSAGAGDLGVANRQAPQATKAQATKRTRIGKPPGFLRSANGNKKSKNNPMQSRKQPMQRREGHYYFFLAK
jgi:hypothetical protein